jgi:hypothetical protein
MNVRPLMLIKCGAWTVSAVQTSGRRCPDESRVSHRRRLILNKLTVSKRPLAGKREVNEQMPSRLLPQA